MELGWVSQNLLAERTTGYKDEGDPPLALDPPNILDKDGEPKRASVRLPGLLHQAGMGSRGQSVDLAFFQEAEDVRRIPAFGEMCRVVGLNEWIISEDRRGDIMTVYNRDKLEVLDTKSLHDHGALLNLFKVEGKDMHLLTVNLHVHTSKVEYWDHANQEFEKNYECEGQRGEGLYMLVTAYITKWAGRDLPGFNVMIVGDMNARAVHDLRHYPESALSIRPTDYYFGERKTLAWYDVEKIEERKRRGELKYDSVDGCLVSGGKLDKTATFGDFSLSDHLGLRGTWRWSE